jgi:type 1 glutamine amidotransferase
MGGEVGRLTLCLLLLSLAAWSAPVRVLVVTGGHSHDTSFYSLFEGQSDVQATVDPHPNAYRGDLRKNYDVVLLYDMIPAVPDKQQQNLRAFLESGKGAIVLHHALATNSTWPWWYEEVVYGRYLLDRSTYKHDVDLEIETVAQHPVTSGLGRFRIVDETYKGMWISPKATVLLRTAHATSDGPVAWISPYEKSRVVVIQLGHDRKAHENASFRRLLRNAILWTGGQ